MYKILIAIVFVTFAFPVMACDSTDLIISLASRHSGNEEFNEKNYGVGVGCNYGKLTYSGGYYDNSYDKTSYYAGVGIETAGKIRGGISLLAVSGYKDFVEGANRVTAIPFPEITADLSLLAVKVGYLPAVNGGPSVTTLRISIPLY